MSIKTQIVTAHDELKAHIDARFDRLEAMLAPAAPSEPAPVDWEISVLGLPPGQEAALLRAGYDTFSVLANASDEELMAVSGIGKRTVEFIRGELAQHGLNL